MASEATAPGSVLHRPLLATSPPRGLDALIDVFGAGRAVRALLTVAALQGGRRRFRIWCRHHSRAELLRIHLADLPPLDVDIIVSDAPPAGGGGPLVLALGRRTSRRSRQKSKDALFDENMRIIDGLMPALAGRAVIVVTNPSTQLTARLASRGVGALGVGVMNDQLRFERDAAPHLRLVGAHNPFELGFGVLGPEGEGLAFSRGAYRDLANRQDRQRPLLDPDGLLARLAPSLHETAWRDLGRLHDDLDVARRWYARQRLASRYLENGIACGRAILALADVLTGSPLDGSAPARGDITVEAPMRLDGSEPFVMGWPLDAVTLQPRALAFDKASVEVIANLASRYGVATFADAAPPPPKSLTLGAPGAPVIRCEGQDVAVLALDLAPLAAPIAPPAGDAPISIRLIDDPALLPAPDPQGGAPILAIAQHRGKNAFEHRDAALQQLGGFRRLASFSASGARALIDDAARQITLAAPPGPGRRDEFRKLLRDQILTAAYAEGGAWILHAGLLRWRGAGLLLLGDSGAGKTTGALHLLSSAQRSEASLCGYGASERVLAFMEGGRLMALGVPESLTIFPGSLRGLPAFAERLEGRERSADWMRASKLRLSRDEVVARLGTEQILAPIPVTHVALLRYQPALEVVATSPAPSAAFRIEALHANDLTHADDVRAAWLGWFSPKPDRAVEAAIAAPGLPFALIDWSRPKALAEALAAHAGSAADGASP